jgi:hypothetical protein
MLSRKVEQWFSNLKRKRLTIAGFAGKAQLAERLDTFVKKWHKYAKPFN